MFLLNQNCSWIFFFVLTIVFFCWKNTLVFFCVVSFLSRFFWIVAVSVFCTRLRWTKFQRPSAELSHPWMDQKVFHFARHPLACSNYHCHNEKTSYSIEKRSIGRGSDNRIWEKALGFELWGEMSKIRYEYFTGKTCSIKISYKLFEFFNLMA